MVKEKEQIPTISDLIWIADEDTFDVIAIHLSDISTIEKVDKHPNNSKPFDNGVSFKYKINCRNCGYNWILVTKENFDKYIKPFIISLN